MRIASCAIEIHGACALSRDLPVEQHFRDACVLTIPDRTSEIQKLTVALSLLGLDAFGERPLAAATAAEELRRRTARRRAFRPSRA